MQRPWNQDNMQRPWKQDNMQIPWKWEQKNQNNVQRPWKQDNKIAGADIDYQTKMMHTSCMKPEKPKAKIQSSNNALKPNP